MRQRLLMTHWNQVRLRQEVEERRAPESAESDAIRPLLRARKRVRVRLRGKYVRAEEWRPDRLRKISTVKMSSLG